MDFVSSEPNGNFETLNTHVKDLDNQFQHITEVVKSIETNSIKKNLNVILVEDEEYLENLDQDLSLKHGVEDTPLALRDTLWERAQRFLQKLASIDTHHVSINTLKDGCVACLCD